VSGNRGTARFINFTIQGPRPNKPDVLHEPFGDIPEANLFGHQLETAWDGSFELYIGGPGTHRAAARPLQRHPPALRSITHPPRR